MENPLSRLHQFIDTTFDLTDLDELRPDEARKVRCGEQHFGEALGVDYRVVTSAGELP